MLVEINLLPQKEPRKQGIILLVTSLLAIIFLISGFYFWQIQSTKSEIASIDKEISMTKKITDAEEKNADKNQASMSVSLLKGAVEWANSYPIQTVPVMQHLTSLLPERGFIQSFGYTEAGTVTLTVQFDSARESAYFLDSLNESEWIDEATLSSLTAEEKEESEETSGQNSNTADSGQNTNESTDNKQSLLFTPDPNNPGSFIITPVDPNELNSSTTDSNNSQTKKTENILPRYIGQFEIKFNKETIKNLITKGDEEGGTAS